MPEIFNKILRSFELPVGEAWKKWGPAAAPMQTGNVPGFLVSQIGGDNEDSEIVFANLEQLVGAITGYIHPSNHGKWTEKLLQFLDSLTQKFISRLRKERYESRPNWQPLAPEHKRITDGDIDRFVALVRPLAMTALFNKAGPQYASNILQFLAIVRPNEVLPELIKRCHCAFNSLTEPHQSSSCVYALISQVCVMLGPGVSDEVRLSLVPLLQELIPSIDINDQSKANYVLYLFDFVFTNIFMEEASSSIGNDNLSEREDKLVRQSLMLDDLFWAYWDQKLKLISACNHQRETSGEGSSVQVINVESDTTMHLGYGPGIAACSDKLFPQLLRRIFDFCRTNVFGETQAAFMTGSLVQSLVVKNPKQTIELFFPWLYKVIMGIKRENPEVISDEYRMDSEVYWYLLLLCDTVMAAGSDILPYYDQLVELLNIANEIKARVANETLSNISTEYNYSC